jgi:hypothetical protein
MITIEFEEPRVAKCECCAGTTTRLTRFVYRDGDAYAVYYAAFSDNHPEQHVSVLVSIGEWADDAPPSRRVAMPIRLWASEGNFNVSVVNRSDSPWQDTEIMAGFWTVTRPSLTLASTRCSISPIMCLQRTCR